MTLTRPLVSFYYVLIIITMTSLHSGQSTDSPKKSGGFLLASCDRKGSHIQLSDRRSDWNISSAILNKNLQLTNNISLLNATFDENNDQNRRNFDQISICCSIKILNVIQLTYEIDHWLNNNCSFQTDSGVFDVVIKLEAMPRIWSWSGYSSQNKRATDSHHQVNSTKDQLPVPSSDKQQQQQPSQIEPSIKLPKVATLSEYSCMQSDDGPGEAAICSYESTDSTEFDQSNGSSDSSTNLPVVKGANVLTTKNGQIITRHLTSPNLSDSYVKLISSSQVTGRVRSEANRNHKNFTQLHHQSAFMSPNFTKQMSSPQANDRTNSNVHASLTKSIWSGRNLNSQGVKMSSKHEKDSGDSIIRSKRDHPHHHHHRDPSLRSSRKQQVNQQPGGSKDGQDHHHRLFLLQGSISKINCATSPGPKLLQVNSSVNSIIANETTTSVHYSSSNFTNGTVNHGHGYTDHSTESIDGDPWINVHFGSKKNITFNFEFAPVMAIKGKTLITIKQNEQLLKLNCRVYGSPLPSINWQKDGMILPPIIGDAVDFVDGETGSSNSRDEEFYSLESNVNSSMATFTNESSVYNSSLSYSISNEIISKCSLKSTFTLTIMNVVDLGLYNCIASNVHGKSRAFYRINAESPRVFTQSKKFNFAGFLIGMIPPIVVSIFFILKLGYRSRYIQSTV